MAVVINRKNTDGDKREKILLAAVEMFLEKDFYQVTIVEIAGRAGVGKGTVYEYFKSKEDLFKESFSYCAEAYIQTFRQQISRPASVEKTMHDIVNTHLAMIKDNRKKLHLLFNERPLSFQELQSWVLEKRQELLRGIVTLIGEGIKLNEIRPGIDVEMAGRLFLALNYVVMGGMVVLDNLDVDEARVNGLLDIFWNGISSK
jgi:AcrR family transcriptional regulator